MMHLKGTPISTGIAHSLVFLCNEEEPVVPHYRIATDKIEQEVLRIHNACDKAIEELQLLKKESSFVSDKQLIAILDLQIHMLKDAEFRHTIDRNIREQQQNAEEIIENYFVSLIHKLEQAGNPLMRERVADVQDLMHRVLHVLVEVKGARQQLTQLDEPSILVAHDMSPSLVMNLKKDLVKGIVLENGGRTSHAAILIRSLGIPAVFNVKEIHSHVSHKTPVVVDGNEGIVVVHPSEGTQRAYQTAIDYEAANSAYYQQLAKQPCVTLDGVNVTLRANAQSLADVEYAKTVHASGIGLFRSEFIFLANERKTLLSEEAQFTLYKQVLEVFADQPVIVRTLDVGADKSLPQFAYYKEANPLLGWRASRLCLDEHELFRSQLRALYRASMYGNLKIMIPFISTESELREVLAVMQEVRDELTAQNIAYNAKVAIGIMIETPAAVLISDQLAKLVDFFSIGTNDLTQYTLAVDRDNPKVARYYKPMHKSVLKLIKMTIDEANTHHTDLSLCGELAADLLAIPLLLGMGLRELSVNAATLTQVREVIRLTTIKEAEALADNVFKSERTTEIVELLKEYREKIFARKNY